MTNDRNIDIEAAGGWFPRAGQAVFGLVWLWLFRRRSRRHLRDLDAHLLRDIGLDSELIRREARKPFWRR